MIILAKPSSPEGPIKFSDIQKTSLTMAWKSCKQDGGSPVINYILEKRETWKSTWMPVTTTKPDITSYCIQNLKDGQQMFFRVTAVNLVGKSEPLESDGITPKSPYSTYIIWFLILIKVFFVTKSIILIQSLGTSMVFLLKIFVVNHFLP